MKLQSFLFETDTIGFMRSDGTKAARASCVSNAVMGIPITENDGNTAQNGVFNSDVQNLQRLGLRRTGNSPFRKTNDSGLVQGAGERVSSATLDLT